jgi:tRNA-dihydrouridine synthase A
MVQYMHKQQCLHGTAWQSIARHMLGLRNGLAGARKWRQVWSNHHLKHLPAHEVWQLAQLTYAHHSDADA